MTSMRITAQLVHLCQLRYRCVPSSGAPSSSKVPMRMSSGVLFSCRPTLCDRCIDGRAVPSAPCRKAYPTLCNPGIQRVLQHVLGTSCDLINVSPRELSPSHHATRSLDSTKPMRAPCNCALSSFAFRNLSVRSILPLLRRRRFPSALVPTCRTSPRRLRKVLGCRCL